MSQVKLSYETLRKLPKPELHRHLDGSVRVSTVLELAKEQGVELPTYDLGELTSLIRVGDNCQSLVEYLQAFEIVLRVMQYPEAITRITYEACVDAAEDGVTYLELRFSPELHRARGMSLTQVMAAVCEGMTLATYRIPKFFVRTIVCGMRHRHHQTQQLAEIAWRYRGNGAVAFDLAGPEEGYPSKDHAAAFDIVREQNLFCTLHSGETGRWKSILYSIRYCGAHRIGHGIALRCSEELTQYVIDRRIPIEVCVTSNVQTKGVSSIADHPVRSFFDKGVVVVPCTDNCTMSDTVLTKEYSILQEHFNFTPLEIVKLIDNGFRSAFLPTYLRERLRVEAMKECLSILKAEGVDCSEFFKSKYVQNIGIDFDTGKHHYWRLPLTSDYTNLFKKLISELPKADLHCRFDGSVSLDFIREQLDLLEKPELLVSAKDVPYLQIILKERDLEKLKGLLCSNPSLAKKLLVLLLQTKEQLELGLESIVKQAVQDRVFYMELSVSPVRHTHKGLTMTQVVEILLAKKFELEKTNNIRINLVIYADYITDSPITFHKLAELTTQFKKKGVVGFGAIGESDLPKENIKFFLPSLDVLKDNLMHCTFSAGKNSEDTITPAIHLGGATRICGGFLAHKSPTVLNYLADHRIPVEVTSSSKFTAATSDIVEFTDSHPVRLLFDNHVPVAICSFHSTLSPSSRVETLLSITTECKFSISELLELMVVGFRHNFQNYQEREELFKVVWEKGIEVLKNNNVEHIFLKKYFPK